MVYMEKLKSYKHKVQYYETDAMAIVHHSNYIRWFEEARLDYLEQIGLPYDEIERRQIMIPVLGASCQYRQAVKFGESVWVDTEITGFNGLKFSVAYKVYDESRTVLHAEGTTEHCFLDAQFRPIRLKKVATDIYEKFSACLD